MPGANVGYIRVSSVDQNLDRQLADIPIDKLFEDKLSGKSRKRPGLDACLDYLREGDTLHVHSIDRLARNLLDLQRMVNELTERGVRIMFHKEGLVFDGSNTNPTSKMLMQILGCFAEFERTLILERQREGIAEAKKKGVKLGRPNKASHNAVQQGLEQGKSKTQIARELGIGRSTLYAYLNVKG